MDETRDDDLLVVLERHIAELCNCGFHGFVEAEAHHPSCDYRALATALERLVAARQSLEAVEGLKGIARDYKKHLDDECAERGCLCTMRGAVPCSAWIDEAINGRS